MRSWLPSLSMLGVLGGVILLSRLVNCTPVSQARIDEHRASVDNPAVRTAPLPPPVAPPIMPEPMVYEPAPVELPRLVAATATDSARLLLVLHQDEAALKLMNRLQQCPLDDSSCVTLAWQEVLVRWRMGDSKELNRALDSLPAGPEFMNDYRDFFRAAALRGLGDPVAAKKRFDRLAAQRGGFSLAGHAAVEAIGCLQDQGEYRLAMTAWRNLKSRDDLPPGTNADLQLAKCLLLLHYPSEALSALRPLLENSAISDDGREALDWLIDRRDLSIIGADLYIVGHACVDVGRPRQGRAYLEKYTQQFRTGKHYQEALLYLGKAALKQDIPAEAVDYLTRAIRVDSKSLIAGYAFLERGRAYAKLDKDEPAVRDWRTVAAQFRQLDLADDAEFSIAEQAYARGNWDEALPAYRKVAEDYPTSKFADRATWLTGLVTYRKGNYADAETFFDRTSRNFSDYAFVTGAKFWREKCRQASGGVPHYEQVGRENFRCYYDFRADAAAGSNPGDPRHDRSDMDEARSQERIGNVYSQLRETHPFTPPNTPFDPAARAFLRGAFLAKMGAVDEAEDELAFYEKRGGPTLGTHLWLWRYYSDNQLFHRAYLKGQKIHTLLGSAEKGGELEQMVEYPLFYHDAVAAECRRYNLDPLYVLSLMKRESRFDPQVVSYAGAVGLMQIMPATGQEIASALGEKGFNKSKLYNPGLNVRYGVWYINEQLKDFDSPYAALAAYNGGPFNVKRWLTPETKKDVDLFVESIDFKQTRHYVKAVMGDYFMYRRVWAQ